MTSRSFGRRTASGLAAAAGMTLVFAMAATPTYAEAPSATPGLDQPDTPSAIAAAKRTGKPVKITGATTATSEYYAKPNGKIVGRISAGVVRFRRNGTWVPVDLTLRRRADGSVAPAAYPGNLWISGARAAGAGDLVSMGTGKNEVTVGWPGALPEPRLDGSNATYPDVLPGVDLVVHVTRTGFEQFAVLKSAAAAKYATEISLPMTGAGVASVTADRHGRVRVDGAGGRKRASIPTPMMWDARSATGGGVPKRRRVPVEVTRSGPAESGGRAAATGPVTLTLTPDQKWLNSPDTVYPVTIDPYYDWSTTATSTTVVKGYASGWPDSDSLFVGSWDSTGTARSFVTWYAKTLQGMQIDSATAHFANPYSSSCDAKPWQLWSTDPIAADTSWDNQPQWLRLEATSTSTSCSDGWVTADATSFFRNAVENGDLTPTMGLRAADEADYSQYKQFWSYHYADSSKFPYVEINYTDPTGSATPAVARAFTEPATSLIQDSTGTCVTGSSRPYVNTTTPKLSAAYADLDSPTVTVTFEWWTLTGTAPLGTATSATAVEDIASAVVKSGQMAGNTAYKWRVKASDGAHTSAWTPWCEFSVDTAAPSVTSDVYGSNSVAGSPGLSGMFTFGPAAVPNVKTYKYGLDTNPPTSAVTASATGQAQVSLAPATAGNHILYVQSVDGAGKTSRITAYSFGVAESDISAAQSSEMRAQAQLIQAADKISDAVDASSPAGFTSVEITDNAVTVWWKGSLPADIQKSVDTARTIAPVVVNQAASSKAELEARADQIRAAMVDPLSAIQTLSIPVDGSGIVVGTADGTTPHSAVIDDPSSGIPVTVVKAAPPTTASGPATRTNDGWNGKSYSSFAGGGTITSPVPGTGKYVKCTAGFGVTNGSEEFLLTAAHCGYPNQTWKNGNGSRTIGKVSHEWSSMDLMLIRTDANRYMWDGGATSGSFTKTVTGWKKAYPGQGLCLSGATTGTHCGWKNSRNLDYGYCGSPDVYSGKRECYDDLIYATSSSINSDHGDSGGPVFATDGGPAVQAVGILSGGGTHAIAYQDFYTANKHWNIRPLT